VEKEETVKTPYTTVAGTGFDAGVLPPGPLQPAGITKKHELVDPYMAGLTDLVSQQELLSEKDWRELQQLVNERMSLNERASKLIERFQARARAKVAAEHEAAKAALREQQKKIAEHREAISALTRELNRKNDLRAQAIAARDQAQQEKRQLSRFAERREIERLNLLLSKREAAAEHATQEAGAVQSRINMMTLVELKPLMEKLNELIGEEMRLNHFVTGQGYTNELGIVVPNRPPL
jgi:hypothetical protein